MDILGKIAEVIESRKKQDPATSYVAGLYKQGLLAISDKVEEEAAETVKAAKAGDKKQLIHETADLWFHSLVLLSHQGLGPQHVLQELNRRFGVSGLVEKANRPHRA